MAFSPCRDVKHRYNFWLKMIQDRRRKKGGCLCEGLEFGVWLVWGGFGAGAWVVRVLPVSRSPRVMSPKRFPVASVVGVGVQGVVPCARV